MRCEGEASVFPSRGANVEKQETGGTTNDEIIKFSCFVGQQANEYICVATRGSIFVLSFRQSELTDALFSISQLFTGHFEVGGVFYLIVSYLFDASFLFHSASGTSYSLPGSLPTMNSHMYLIFSSGCAIFHL